MKPHPPLFPVSSVSAFQDPEIHSAKDKGVLGSTMMTSDEAKTADGRHVLIVGAGITGLLIAQGLKKVRDGPTYQHGGGNT